MLPSGRIIHELSENNMTTDDAYGSAQPETDNHASIDLQQITTPAHPIRGLRCDHQSL